MSELICNHCKHLAHCGHSCTEEECENCTECACDNCQQEIQHELGYN